LNLYFIKVTFLQDYFILSSPAKQWVEQIDDGANVKFQRQPLVVDATLAAGKKKRRPIERPGSVLFTVLPFPWQRLPNFKIPVLAAI
jgi:hypothetical protein